MICVESASHGAVDNLAAAASSVLQLKPTMKNQSKMNLRLLMTLVMMTALAACGGGGGDSTLATAAAPAPQVSVYDECVALPSIGTVNLVLNSPRIKREWRNATFLGEAVVGRFEYASSNTNALPLRIRYFRKDAASGATATLGTEVFDGAGNLTLREQYVARVFQPGMSVGQTQTTDYVVRTLFPAGQADRQERTARTYLGNQGVNLPGGRLDTCQVREIQYVLAGAVATEVSTELLNYAKGLSWVKSYFTNTVVGASDRNQTYMVELLSSTASANFLSAAATTAPSLASCSAFAANQTLRLTSLNAAEADSGLRVTRSAVFNGNTVLTVERRQATSEVLTQRRHYDAAVGLLRSVGREFMNATGTAVVETTFRSGIPDLRTLAIGDVSNYVVTTQSSSVAVATTSRPESVTFLGHEKVTTPAGTFDTCKVRYVYGTNGLEGSETVYYAPGLHWVRLDGSDAAGLRTTRELVSKLP
jgi:hypothetical protein